MDISKEKFLKPSEVCRLLRISRGTFHNLRRAGKFPASIKIGNSERFTLADIELLTGFKKS